MINYQDREYKLPASLIPYYEKLCDIVFLNLYLREVRKEIQILNPCLYAPSGVGKTEIVLYLAKYFYADIVLNRIEKFLANNQNLKERLIRKLYPNKEAIPKNLKEPENVVVVRLLLQTYLPDEILGVPRAVQVEILTAETSHITKWTIPEWEEKVRVISKTKPVVLFLDELDKPTTDAVSAVLTLLSNRTIRDRELPDNVIIVGAMQNVPYDEAELIDDRTKEALFRRLFFIPIKDITIYVNTIRNFEIPISPNDELYEITQFGGRFKEAFGTIYKIDPIYPPAKSPREIAYLGNLLQALAEFKLIPTREMVENYNRSIDEDVKINDSMKQQMKIDLNELDKEKNVNNMFYLSSEKAKEVLGETVKGLHYYFSDFDKDKETKKICVLLYRTFVYEAGGKREVLDEDLETFAKIEKEGFKEGYLNSIRNLYTTLFSNNPLTFTKYLSYAILTTPYEIVKNELYNSNLNLYNFYLNKQGIFNEFLAEHILVYPTLYGFINKNRKRFEKILRKYENYVDMSFNKNLTEFPAFYILELFFFIFITNIILISSALIYEYIDKPSSRKELENKFSDFTFQIKLLLGEDMSSRLLKGTPNTISYYIGEELNDNPDEIRKTFFENLFKFTDPRYIQEVKEEKEKWQVEFLMPKSKSNVDLIKIREEIYENGKNYGNIGYGGPMSEVALKMIENLEKANDKFVITCLNIYKNAIALAGKIYEEVNNEEYNVLLKK
jgi:hypothetical protein